MKKNYIIKLWVKNRSRIYTKNIKISQDFTRSEALTGFGESYFIDC
jgi:hypothetical protein